MKNTKSVAFLTLVVFLFSQNSLTGISFAQPAQASDVSRIPRIQQVNIPNEIGTVEEVYDANPGGESPLIVYIQDAHCNFEAQSNIRKIIDVLQKDHALGLVTVEGGSGRIDPLLYRAFPDAQIKHRVIEDYVRRGEMSGAEYAAIVNDRESDFWGIEDMKAYYENKKAFLEAIVNQGRIDARLARVEKEIAAIREKIYTPALKELSQKTAAFDAGRLDMLSYVAYLESLRKKYVKGESFPEITKLLQAMKREKAISQEKVNGEAERLSREIERAMKNGREENGAKELARRESEFKRGELKRENYLLWLTGKSKELRLFTEEELVNRFPLMHEYLDHVREMEKIEGEELFKEIDALQAAIKERLFESKRQKDLDTLFHKLRILRNLAKLELTRDELAEYRKNKDDFSEIRFWDFIGKPAPAEKFDNLFEPHARFYEWALKRDENLHKNLMEALSSRNRKFAAAVTGGFHSNGIKEMLKKDGVSYVLVVPRITDFEERSPYWDVMRGNVSYAKFLKKETLSPEVFLAVHKKAAEEGISEEFAQAAGDNLPVILQGWRNNVAANDEYRRVVQGLIDKYVGKGAEVSTAVAAILPDIAKILDEYLKGERQAALEEINALEAKLNAEGAFTTETILDDLKAVFPNVEVAARSLGAGEEVGVQLEAVTGQSLGRTAVMEAIGKKLDQFKPDDFSFLARLRGQQKLTEEEQSALSSLLDREQIPAANEILPQVPLIIQEAVVKQAGEWAKEADEDAKQVGRPDRAQTAIATYLKNSQRLDRLLKLATPENFKQIYPAVRALADFLKANHADVVKDYTDNATISQAVFEKAADLMFRAVRAKEGENVELDINLALISIPVGRANSLRDVAMGTELKEKMIEAVRKITAEKEKKAEVRYQDVEGSSQAYAGTRLVILGLSKEEVRDIIDNTFPAVIGELQKKYGLQPPEVESLKAYGAITKIGGREQVKEFKKQISEDRDGGAERLQNHIVEQLKEVWGIAQVLEELPRSLDAPPLADRSGLVSLARAPPGLDQRIEAARQNYIPQNNFETGKLPRPSHDIERVMGKRDQPDRFGLENLSLKLEILADETEPSIISDGINLLREDYAVTSAYNDLLVVRSLQDIRYPRSYKMNSIQKVIGADESGSWLELTRRLWEHAADTRFKQEKGEFERTAKDAQRGFYMGKLGDEIGLYYRIDGELKPAAFLELNKFNAAMKQYTPDKKDSFYHKILESIRKLATVDYNTDFGTMTREKNIEFLEKINEAIANTEVEFDHDIELKAYDGSRFGIPVSRVERIREDGTEVRVSTFTTKIQAGDKARVKDLEFHYTEKINGKRMPLYVNKTTGQTVGIEDFNAAEPVAYGMDGKVAAQIDKSLFKPLMGPTSATVTAATATDLISPDGKVIDIRGQFERMGAANAVQKKYLNMPDKVAELADIELYVAEDKLDVAQKALEAKKGEAVKQLEAQNRTLQSDIARIAGSTALLPQTEIQNWISLLLKKDMDGLRRSAAPSLKEEKFRELVADLQLLAMNSMMRKRIGEESVPKMFRMDGEFIAEQLSNKEIASETARRFDQRLLVQANLKFAGNLEMVTRSLDGVVDRKAIENFYSSVADEQKAFEDKLKILDDLERKLEDDSGGLLTVEELLDIDTSLRFQRAMIARELFGTAAVIMKDDKPLLREELEPAVAGAIDRTMTDQGITAQRRERVLDRALPGVDKSQADPELVTMLRASPGVMNRIVARFSALFETMRSAVARIAERFRKGEQTSEPLDVVLTEEISREFSPRAVQEHAQFLRGEGGMENDELAFIMGEFEIPNEEQITILDKALEQTKYTETLGRRMVEDMREMGQLGGITLEDLKVFREEKNNRALYEYLSSQDISRADWFKVLQSAIMEITLRGMPEARVPVRAPVASAVEAPVAETPVAEPSVPQLPGAPVVSDLGDELSRLGLTQTEIAGLVMKGEGAFRENLGAILRDKKVSFDTSVMSHDSISQFVNEGKARMNDLNDALGGFSPEDFKNFTRALENPAEPSALSQERKEAILAVLLEFEIVTLTPKLAEVIFDPEKFSSEQKFIDMDLGDGRGADPRLISLRQNAVNNRAARIAARTNAENFLKLVVTGLPAKGPVAGASLGQRELLEKLAATPLIDHPTAGPSLPIWITKDVYGRTTLPKAVAEKAILSGQMVFNAKASEWQFNGTREDVAELFKQNLLEQLAAATLIPHPTRGPSLRIRVKPVLEGQYAMSTIPKAVAEKAILSGQMVFNAKASEWQFNGTESDLTALVKATSKPLDVIGILDGDLFSLYSEDFYDKFYKKVRTGETTYDGFLESLENFLNSPGRNIKVLRQLFEGLAERHQNRTDAVRKSMRDGKRVEKVDQKWGAPALELHPLRPGERNILDFEREIARRVAEAFKEKLGVVTASPAVLGNLKTGDTVRMDGNLYFITGIDEKNGLLLMKGMVTTGSFIGLLGQVVVRVSDINKIERVTSTPVQAAVPAADGRTREVMAGQVLAVFQEKLKREPSEAEIDQAIQMLKDRKAISIRDAAENIVRSMPKPVDLIDILDNNFSSLYSEDFYDKFYEKVNAGETTQEEFLGALEVFLKSPGRSVKIFRILMEKIAERHHKRGSLARGSLLRGEGRKIVDFEREIVRSVAEALNEKLGAVTMSRVTLKELKNGDVVQIQGNRYLLVNIDEKNNRLNLAGPASSPAFKGMLDISTVDMRPTDRIERVSPAPVAGASLGSLEEEFEVKLPDLIRDIPVGTDRLSEITHWAVSELKAFEKEEGDESSGRRVEKHLENLFKYLSARIRGGEFDPILIENLPVNVLDESPIYDELGVDMEHSGSILIKNKLIGDWSTVRSVGFNEEGFSTFTVTLENIDSQRLQDVLKNFIDAHQAVGASLGSLAEAFTENKITPDFVNRIISQLPQETLPLFARRGEIYMLRAFEVKGKRGEKETKEMMMPMIIVQRRDDGSIKSHQFEFYRESMVINLDTPTGKVSQAGELSLEVPNEEFVKELKKILETTPKRELLDFLANEAVIRIRRDLEERAEEKPIFTTDMVQKALTELDRFLTEPGREPVPEGAEQDPSYVALKSYMSLGVEDRKDFMAIVQAHLTSDNFEPLLNGIRNARQARPGEEIRPKMNVPLPGEVRGASLGEVEVSIERELPFGAISPVVSSLIEDADVGKVTAEFDGKSSTFYISQAELRAMTDDQIKERAEYIAGIYRDAFSRFEAIGGKVPKDWKFEMYFVKVNVGFPNAHTNYRSETGMVFTHTLPFSVTDTKNYKQILQHEIGHNLTHMAFPGGLGMDLRTMAFEEGLAHYLSDFHGFPGGRGEGGTIHSYQITPGEALKMSGLTQLDIENSMEGSVERDPRLRNYAGKTHHSFGIEFIDLFVEILGSERLLEFFTALHAIKDHETEDYGTEFVREILRKMEFSEDQINRFQAKLLERLKDNVFSTKQGIPFKGRAVVPPPVVEAETLKLGLPVSQLPSGKFSSMSAPGAAGVLPGGEFDYRLPDFKKEIEEWTRMAEEAQRMHDEYMRSGFEEFKTRPFSERLADLTITPINFNLTALTPPTLRQRIAARIGSFFSNLFGRMAPAPEVPAPPVPPVAPPEEVLPPETPAAGASLGAAVNFGLELAGIRPEIAAAETINMNQFVEFLLTSPKGTREQFFQELRKQTIDYFNRISDPAVLAQAAEKIAALQAVTPDDVIPILKEAGFPLEGNISKLVQDINNIQSQVQAAAETALVTRAVAENLDSLLVRAYEAVRSEAENEKALPEYQAARDEFANDYFRTPINRLSQLAAAGKTAQSSIDQYDAETFLARAQNIKNLISAIEATGKDGKVVVYFTTQDAPEINEVLTKLSKAIRDGGGNAGGVAEILSKIQKVPGTEIHGSDVKLNAKKAEKAGAGVIFFIPDHAEILQAAPIGNKMTADIKKLDRMPQAQEFLMKFVDTLKMIPPGPEGDEARRKLVNNFKDQGIGISEEGYLMVDLSVLFRNIVSQFRSAMRAKVAA